MRRWVLFFFLLCCVPAVAQFTTVAGTVVDPNGIPYSNGTIVPTLVSSSSPTLNGFPYSPPAGPVGLDISGSFTMNLANQAALSPGGTTWSFNVCSASGTVLPAGGTGPQCFVVAGIVVAGTSQSISTQLQAAAKALTRQTSGSGVIFPIAGSATPTPVGSNTCPAGMNVSGWVQNAAGVYQSQFAVDTSLTTPASGDTRFGSPGILTFCRPVIFNGSGIANPGGARQGQAFSVYGALDLFTNNAILVQSEYTNSVSDNQTYTTGNLNSFYSELEINGTPTINTTFVSTYRARLDDNKTGGSKPRAWSVFQGETNKTAIYDITNCGSSGIDGFATDCYSIFYGEQGANIGTNEDETGVTYSVFSGGTKDLGAHALNATGTVFHALFQGSTGNRFVNSNGFVSEDSGTASGYYNFVSKGVNASGTPSGASAFQGPSVFGAISKAPATVQVQVIGGSLENSSFTFATLPTSPNGSQLFCSDCNATCTAGGGTGRTCFRENGAWTR